ncbi:hypothetical protein GCM10027046_37750 [Uliginosibacterium flavum]
MPTVDVAATALHCTEAGALLTGAALAAEDEPPPPQATSKNDKGSAGRRRNASGYAHDFEMVFIVFASLGWVIAAWTPIRPTASES